MYLIVFSNGFQTIIDWDGVSCARLADVWNIAKVHYNLNDLSTVVITKIAKLTEEDDK